MNIPESFTFDPTNLDQLPDWLNFLAKRHVSQASTELHQVLLNLLQNNLPPAVKLELLNQLSEPVQHYANQLETLVLKNALQQKSLIQKTAKLSSQMLIQLSLNYCQLCKSTELDQQQLLSCLYLGLHCIGLSQYKQAVFKQAPSARLWKKSADLYQLSLTNDLYQTPMAQTEFVRIVQSTCKEILQRNLLFSICKPYHFQSAQINKLFEFADNRFGLVKLDNIEKSVDFIWILNQEHAPIPFNKMSSVKQDALYIDVAPLVEQFSVSTLTLPESDCMYIKHRLSGYAEILNNIIPAAPAQYQLILEQAQIGNYLNHSAAMENIRRISDESAQKRNSLNELQIESHNPQGTVTNKNILDSDSKTRKQLYSSSVYKTRFESFILASVPLLPLQVDQPVLLIKPSAPLQLGFIRQIELSLTHNNLRILIEVKLGQIQHSIVSIDQENFSAILIKHDTGKIEALLPPGTYSSASKIQIQSRSLSGTFVLDEFMESTPLFLRYQLLPE